MRASVKRPRARFGAPIVLLGFFLSAAASAQPAPTATNPPQQAPTSPLAAPEATGTPTPEEEWRGNMARKRVPKGGCYEATQPDTDWKEVPCTAPPDAEVSCTVGKLVAVPGAGAIGCREQRSR